MSAELSARRIAAEAVVTDYARRWAAKPAGAGSAVDWQTWAVRLAAELGSLLEQLDADDTFTRPQLEPAAAKLAEIRGVLDVFDWERDDRQFALEQIDDILRGQP